MVEEKTAGYIFCGLGWPWVMNFVGFNSIIVYFPTQPNLLSRKHPVCDCRQVGTHATVEAHQSFSERPFTREGASSTSRPTPRSNVTRGRATRRTIPRPSYYTKDNGKHKCWSNGFTSLPFWGPKNAIKKNEMYVRP